ncbi:HAD family hydrolase [Mycoplasmopsis citelli]|uniref:Putative phosphotransferase n=1 Tax=Mycoplasmopsis citelli TaxID=171281 RepID=A0A449B0Y4_9BACT|nr:HAD family hydrolase [Mycoplasmopsis citelli]UUD36570.1 HAD family hydrolase [Mycoplasmopsis citelli]VEU74205.1 putative phosphotransferase [Mycoplasmopsis citelli]
MDKLKNSDFEYVFFDLDGTLLNSKKEILPSSKEAIATLKKLNKKMSIITGRPPYLAKEEFLSLNLHYPVICCNGALIYDFYKNKIVYKNPIDPQSTKQVFDILIKNNVTFLIYTTTKGILGFYNKETLPEWFSWISSTNAKRKPENQFPFEYHTYFEWKALNFEITKEEIVKFLVIKSDSRLEDAQQAATELTNVSNIYMINSQAKVFDIMPVGISKGDSLKKLAQLYEINLDKTLVFGDEDNDISMFKVAKYSVAMGQSKDAVKQHASYITTSNDEDGIYQFLNKIK